MAGELQDEGDIPVLDARWCGMAGGGETRPQRGQDQPAHGGGQN
jgi:hypothetical protein